MDISRKQNHESDDSSSSANGAQALDRRLFSVSLEALHSNPSNPRSHSRAQIGAIAKSIGAFGFNAPILIDQDNKIVAGHGRFQAAKLAGLTHVPVIRLDHLSATQARAYMLADNKLTDRSKWDEPVLAQHLKDLSQLALEFQIEDTGFETPEIDFRIQSLDPPDSVSEVDDLVSPGETAVSRQGDLWVLGDHRIYCGNALEPTSYEVLLGDNRAAAVITDPPYNVKIDGHVCGAGQITHREFAMAAGEMNGDEFTHFLQTTLQRMRSRSAPGALFYIFMDWRHIAETMAAARSTACRYQVRSSCPSR